MIYIPKLCITLYIMFHHSDSKSRFDSSLSAIDTKTTPKIEINSEYKREKEKENNIPVLFVYVASDRLVYPIWGFVILFLY